MNYNKLNIYESLFKSFIGVDTFIVDILKRGAEAKDKEEQKVDEVEKEGEEQKDEEKDKQENN